MPEKTPGKPRKTAKPPASDLASAGSAQTDRYIAEQLKAVYDAVAAEPVPDRLLELLNRLDADAKK
ncbi:MAG TPA: NepR family anti-sigma factor [Roseiarcus sp.]|jgi:hypothetical protein